MERSSRLFKTQCLIVSVVIRKKKKVIQTLLNRDGIRTTFEISDKYNDFKVLDLKTCQSIIKGLEAVTHKLDIVNFM